MHLAKAPGTDFYRGDCPGTPAAKQKPETNDQKRWCSFISAIFYAKFLRWPIIYLTSTGSFALVKHTQSELSLFSPHAFLNSYQKQEVILKYKIDHKKNIFRKNVKW